MEKSLDINLPHTSSIGSISPTFIRLTFQLCISALVYLFFVCIYNLTLHPLAKYPGPFLAKVTDLYAAYHAWKGDIHLDMWRCHEKYGKFVRYAPNRLNTNTTAAIKDIYAQGKNFRKSRNYGAMVHQALNTLTISDPKEHGRRRRVVSQGFSDSAMWNYEPSMVALVHRFCDRLLQPVEEEPAGNSDLWGPARNMSQWCNYLAFDIMADLIFGGKYNLLERETYRYVPGVIEASNVRVSAILQAPGLKFGRLDKILFPKAVVARDVFIRFVGKLLRDTLKVDRSKKRDFFAVLSTAKDPQTGSGFTEEEIIAESTTLIVAGADTVATATTALFFYLSRNPAAYKRAANEVRSTFQTVNEIHMGPKLNSCKYLRACVDETMRMSPSVGSSLAREVQQGGAIVDSEYIPAGCDVGVPIYSIQHSAEYFSNPFSFSPERWILGERDTTQESLSLASSAYVPFSSGPRGCIGKGMALTEMMLTMATVLWRLDFKIAEGDSAGGSPDAEWGRHRPDEFQLKDHVTAARNGPLLHFQERKIPQGL